MNKNLQLTPIQKARLDYVAELYREREKSWLEYYEGMGLKKEMVDLEYSVWLPSHNAQQEILIKRIKDNIDNETLYRYLRGFLFSLNEDDVLELDKIQELVSAHEKVLEAANDNGNGGLKAAE